MLRSIFPIAFLLALAGCIHSPARDHDVPQPSLAVRDLVRGELVAGQSFEMDAYALSFGELLLYDSEEAADQRLIYPYCLSANSKDFDNAGVFDRKWVRVSGTLIKEDQYNDPPKTIRTMGSAGGLPFQNGCWGPFMLRIEKIGLIKKPSE